MKKPVMQLIYCLLIMLLTGNPLISYALEGNAHSNTLVTPSLENEAFKDTKTYSKTYSFAELNWRDGNKLRADRATTSFYLPVPKLWKYTNIKLHLIISHSPLLTNNSNLTFELNNNPVASILLNKENASPSVWNIETPLGHLKEDWLALNFIGFLRVSADLCTDYDNPSNWAYISPDSTITVNYKKRDIIPDLSQLPYPFIFNNPLDPLTSLLVLPAHPSIKDLTPALQLAKILGEQLNYNQIKLDTAFVNTITATQKEKNNLIFVGKVNQFTAIDSDFMHNIVSGATSLKSEIAPDSGIISLVLSPWNALNSVLTVTGDSDLAIEKAVFALGQARFNKLYGKLVFITEKAKAFKSEKPDNIDAPITLKELGYTDQTALGVGQNTLSYTFTLPNNYVPDELTLNTLVSHSAFTNRDHSLLTVSVNGVKQSSILLLSGNQSNATWPIQIRGDVLNPGKNSLTYTFDLHLPQENCSPRLYFQAWGVIHAGTSLQTSFSKLFPRIVLSHFPLALSTKTYIVLPVNLDAEQIGTLVQLFLKFGVLLGYDSPEFAIVGADEANVSAMLKNHSSILIGTPQNNPWIAKAMETAPLKIVDGKVTLNSAKSKFSYVEQVPLAVLELIDSPWNNDLYTILITGTSGDAVNWAMHLLINDKIRPQLTGNIATSTIKGTLANFESRPGVIHSLMQGLSKKTKQSMNTYIYQNVSFIVIFIFLIIVIVLAAMGFYIRRKK